MNRQLRMKKEKKIHEQTYRSFPNYSLLVLSLFKKEDGDTLQNGAVSAHVMTDTNVSKMFILHIPRLRISVLILLEF